MILLNLMTLFFKKIFDKIEYREYRKKPHDLSGAEAKPIGQGQADPSPEQREQDGDGHGYAPEHGTKAAGKDAGYQVEQEASCKADRQRADDGNIFAGDNDGCIYRHGELILFPARRLVADKAHHILDPDRHGEHDGSKQPRIDAGIEHEQQNKDARYQDHFPVNTFKKYGNILVNQTFHAAPPLM